MSQVNAPAHDQEKVRTIDSDAKEVLEIVGPYLTKATLTADIIEATPEARRAYFDCRTVLHANMNRVFLDIWNLLHKNRKELLVFIFGPSGVGKSALRILLALVYLMEHIKEMNERKEWLPLTQNELVQRSDRYSWREFYRGGLFACKEPLVDCKILPRGPLNESYIPSGKATVDLWGNAYADATERRGVLRAFVDEADKLAKIKSKDKEALTNPLIGLSRMCPHYLFGTYTILDLRNRNAQIARRSKSFHFPRYHSKDPEENREFQKALNGLADQLPIKERPDLTEYTEFIFRRSNGSIGVLHDWLADALDLAMEENAHTITFQHLRKTQPDDDSLHRFEVEAANGEQRFLDLKDEYERATQTLDGVEDKWVAQRGAKRGEKAQDMDEQPKEAQSGKSNGKRGNHRPGRTKARKISIGRAIPKVRRGSSPKPQSRVS
jgi:hypothetical protein